MRKFLIIILTSICINSYSQTGGEKVNCSYLCDSQEWSLDTIVLGTNYYISYFCSKDSGLVSEYIYTNLKTGEEIKDCFHNYSFRYIARDLNGNKIIDTTIDKYSFKMVFIKNMEFLNNSYLASLKLLKVRKDRTSFSALIGYPRSDYSVIINFTVKNTGGILIDKIISD